MIPEQAAGARRALARGRLPGWLAVLACSAMALLPSPAAAQSPASCPGVGADVSATKGRTSPASPGGLDGSSLRWEVGHAVSLADRAGRTEVSFSGSAEWPHAIVRATGDHWDLATAGQLLLPVHNPGSAVTLRLRLGDDAQATWPEHAIAAHFELPAASTRTLVLPLCAIDPRQMGMRTGPPPRAPAGVPDAVLAQGLEGRLDLARARSLFLVIDGRQGARTLGFGQPQTRSASDPSAVWRGLIDGFGQYSGASWPGKAVDEQAWRRDIASQARRWTPDPQADGLGAIVSGAAASPRFEASGFFRTARDPQGRWWFVTPTGQGFFSIGVNTVDLHDGATYVEGREWMFQDLPAATAGAPLAAHYGRSDLRRDMGAQAGRRFDHGRYFNFYTANLQRLYGKDWQAQWVTESLRRLRAWGFNTLGNWSHADLHARGRKDRLPFTVALSIEGDFARISDGVDYWGRMPDPFDPRFASAVDTVVRQGTAPHRGDALLLGYFVDNELAWGDGSSPDPRRRHALVIHALEGPDSPARRALLGLLAGRHTSVAAWQAHWGGAAVQLGGELAAPDKSGADRPAAASPGKDVPGSDAAAWTRLTHTKIRLAKTFDQAALAELSMLSRALADAYYRTVAEALRRHDPDHLYLGSRFAAQTDEAVGACDQHCDVVSFNIYHQTFADARRARFGELTKPALVGEYNFSSTDRGPFWPGLVDVGSEAARGPHYAAYLRAVAEDPQFVGAHWFQYLDEPASGRLLDGENAHFGLVAITDLAYGGFIDAVTAANREAPRRRAGAQAPTGDRRLR